MLSVYSLLKAGLLLLNALAVLHPGRFLRVYGIVESSEDASAKSRLASTLAWSRGLQWPLVFVNLLICLIEVIFG